MADARDLVAPLCCPEYEKIAKRAEAREAGVDLSKDKGSGG